MVPLTSSQLLGFKPPFADTGEWVLPVLTASGEWLELRATPATWRRIALAIALQATPAPTAAKPAPTARVIAVQVDESHPHDAPLRPLARS
ncbi:MAG: hypothetical protein V4773_28795 [Verrucomicrobiota bacterium]